MKTHFQRKVLAIAVASVSLLGYAVSGTAAEGRSGLVLEEVIVTATKQEETVNNVGASIMAVTNQQINNLGFRTMSSVVASMPNVNVYEGSTGTKLTVRGVGTPPTGGASSSVATFIDGVYQGNSSQTNNILVDMERIEILRGPQGTLFGKNSIAGVFNLISARPTQEFEGMIDLRGGNYDSHEGTVVVSGGLTDSLSARFVAYKQHTGDYMKNTIVSGGAGGADKESYRLSLNWDVSDDTSVWFKYQHDHLKRNAATTQLIALDPADAAHLASLDPSLLARTDTKLDGKYAAGYRTYYGLESGLNPDSVLNTGRDTVAASFNHVFANEYEFTAIAGLDRNKILNRGNTSQDYPLVTIYLNTESLYETKNVEFRLSSPTQDRFHFTVGAYAEKSKYGIESGDGYVAFDGLLTATLNGIMGNPVPDAQLSPALITDVGTPYGWNKTTSLAAYFQGTYEFTDEWSLTAGIRYADDEITQTKDFSTRKDLNGNPLFSAQAFEAVAPGLGANYAFVMQNFLNPFIGIGIPGDASYKETHRDRAVLPAGKLEFRPNPDSLYYLSVQTGYKNGGFSTDGLKYPNPFNKEKSIAFEIGGKIAVADGRGQVNGSIFRTDFKDLQVANIDPTSGGVLFTNAAKAFSQGVELEGRWKLTENLTAGLRYAYLNAEYKSFDNAPGSISQQIINPNATQDLSGEPLTFAPKNSGSASLDYTQPLTDALEIQSNLLVSCFDSSYSDLSNSDELKAHSATLVDLSIALVNVEQQWRVAVIGQNLTDDRGMVNGTPSSLLGKGTYFGAMRQPATYWLQLVKQF